MSSERKDDVAEHRHLERRQLLRNGAAAAGLAALGGLGTLALRDRDGERGKPGVDLKRLPENGYAVEPMAAAADLGVAQGKDILAMVKSAIASIGGIRRFVATGDVVAIKPNVAFERAAALGATTNPEVLAALVRVCREAGASEVRVLDNPIESPESCFARSGIRKATYDSGARLYLPSAGSFETLEVPGAKWIAEWPFFWLPFVGVDKVIGVAPVKDHNLCRASMTTKNWYGLLGGRRNQFHQDIHGIITDLALMMRPTLVVLDATRVLFRSGPTGGSLDDVRDGNTIVASTDSLAADAFGWDNLLGRASEDKPAYFSLAADKGLGNPEWRQLEVKEEQVG